ncbi:MAG: hypothetical protein EKK57_02270 [Proteobacteria bacterium]|nr:MAG: hypothetical protein EKK57_02270 [Pseudomonadota bacterium]
MLVTNPNNESVITNPSNNTSNQIFSVQGTQLPTTVKPMQFVEDYNGEISGYSNTPDCLSLVNKNQIIFGKNQSCVYKFRAFWNANLDMSNLVNFNVSYSIADQNNTNNVYYSTETFGSYPLCSNEINSNCYHKISNDEKNSLSYQNLALKSSDNIMTQLNYPIFQKGYNITYSGNKVFAWIESIGNYVKKFHTTNVISYDLNYNSSTNTFSISNSKDYNTFGTKTIDSLNNIYYKFDFPAYQWVSQFGDNFGALDFINNGITASDSVNGVNGTNGSSFIILANGQILKSTNGDFISNYSLVGTTNPDLKLQGFDETNNVAILNDNHRSYCFNLTSGVTKTVNIVSSNNLYDAKPVNNAFIEVVNFNNKIYYASTTFYFQSQNKTKEYSNAQNGIFILRKFDTVNCTNFNDGALTMKSFGVSGLNATNNIKNSYFGVIAIKNGTNNNIYIQPSNNF